MNREIAGDLEVPRGPFLNLRRLERHRRIFGDIEEMRTLQILVAVWFSRVNGRSIDRHFNRGLCDVTVINAHRPVDCVKLSSHLGNHQMRNRELGRAML